MVNRQPTVARLGCFMHGNSDARGLYMEPSVLFTKPGAKRMKRYMAGKLTSVASALVQPLCLEEVRRYLNEFVERCLADGFSPLDVPDLFYFDQRARRFTGSAVRASLPIADVIQPFIVRRFLTTCYQMTPFDRFRQQFHNIGFDLLAPAELKAVPFDSDPALWRSLARGVGHTAARMGARGLRRRRYSHTPQRKTLEAVLPELRQVCLDQTNSDLWRLIDRRVFERLLAPQTPARDRAAYTETIFQVGTLFCYQNLLDQIGN